MLTTLTQERLKELLHYDPETGVFTRKVSRTRTHEGDVAGCPGTGGYLRIRVDNDRYMAHRLAYLYMYGEFPPDKIDHHDRDTTNNRISNLRPATTKQNGENRSFQKNNTSGFRGVTREPSGKWRAQICHHRKQVYLGMFDTPEEASAVYEAARDRLFTYN